MKTKSRLLLFGVLALVQLAIPFQMIYHQEDILNNGKLWKFKTAPVDPNDPFRGKYIYLNFEQSNFEIKGKSKANWQYNQTVYANLVKDENGFAKIVSIASQRPNQPNYLEVKVGYTFASEANNTRVSINFPFDRYYMNEYKAENAERIYIESNRTEANKKEAYALIAIKDGESVIKDVLIDNISVKVLATKK